MIVRILSEGQWQIDDSARSRLNELDDALEAAVAADDAAGLAGVLQQIHDRVRELGVPLADDLLADSDLILPDVDASLTQVRALLTESGQGLIPD